MQKKNILGSGTSHRVNGILIQHGPFGNTAYEKNDYEPKQKRSRRSFEMPERNTEIVCNFGKRVGPTDVIVPENEERHMLLAKQELLHLIWIISRKAKIPQAIPSWTGFNIKIRSEVRSTKSLIAYLESIDSPATDIVTIYEILDRC